MQLPRFLSLFLVFYSLQSSGGYSHAHSDKRVLPRYASLRSDNINLRRGPGKQYLIDWIYVRAGLPVEIIAEFDVWRQIRDHEGIEGWAHQSMISGRRNIIVIHDNVKLYSKPDKYKGQALAIIKKNVIGRVLECQSTFCRIQFKNHKGWLKRQDIWGVKIWEEKFK